MKSFGNAFFNLSHRFLENTCKTDYLHLKNSPEHFFRFFKFRLNGTQVSFKFAYIARSMLTF